MAIRAPRPSPAIRARHVLVRVLAILGVVLVVGGVPGSASLRPLVVERAAPPLPEDTRDRDAELDVTVRAEGGATIVTRARADVVRVQAFTVLPGPAGEGPRAYLAGTGEADQGGRATLGDLPRGETWIVAEAAGFARASSHVVLDRGPRSIEMVLGAAHRLDVEVKDERGEPVAVAEVEAIAAADPLPVGARAGRDGVAHVTRLSAAPWVVTARAAGYEEVTYRGVAEGQVLHATLRRLGALAVRVVGEDGAPAAFARVMVASASLWPARVADASKEGAVRIGGLGEGSYALRATAGERASPIELGILLGRGEEKAVTLRLGPGQRVAVRVTEGEGDLAAPVQGARVTLSESGLSPFPIEATTDREGRAHLGPIARGASTLAARADGFVARGAVSVPDPAPGEVRIALVRGGVVLGRVVDARGYPVDGATIEIVGTDFYGAPIDDDPRRTRFRDAHFVATLAGPSRLIPAGELGVVPGPVPPIPHGQSAATPLALGSGGGGGGGGGAGAPAPGDEPWITRDDGTFRASPVSPGRVRALVRHPQYVEALSDLVTLAPGGEATVDVVMHAGGVLEGRVVDAGGHPVGGARVVVAASRGSMERATRSATDGTFAFAAVPQTVTVMASPDDEGSPAEARATVDVPEGGKKSVTLTLPAARDPLPARVTDDRGYALEAAQVTAVSLDPSSALRATAFTDARGEAQIAGARGLALRVEVSAPGHAAKVVTTEADLASLVVALAAAESARGEVRSARGDAIDGAELVLYTTAGARHARADASGLFAFGDLPPGAARLRVRAAGFVSVTNDVTIATSGGRRPTELPRVELAPGGSVEGQVLDARGDPVAGARVALDRVPTYLTVGGSPAGVAVADARGTFRLGDLPEGAVTLEAYAPDVGRARSEGVRVVAGRTARDVRITLRSEKADRPDDRSAAVDDAAGGVAVTLGETAEPREVVLVSVVEASEAERAGLVPGDVVVAVDGKDVHTLSEARRRLSGPLGVDVLVKVRRGERTEALRIAREQVRR